MILVFFYLIKRYLILVSDPKLSGWRMFEAGISVHICIRRKISVHIFSSVFGSVKGFPEI